jgi:hypothetical protein
LPQILFRPRPGFPHSIHLFTPDFLLRRKFHRNSAKRHGLSKVGLIFARSGAMVDCAAQYEINSKPSRIARPVREP